MPENTVVYHYDAVAEAVADATANLFMERKQEVTFYSSRIKSMEQWRKYVTESPACVSYDE